LESGQAKGNPFSSRERLKIVFFGYKVLGHESDVLNGLVDIN
jgi:hypothetical protein